MEITTKKQQKFKFENNVKLFENLTKNLGLCSIFSKNYVKSSEIVSIVNQQILAHNSGAKSYPIVILRNCNKLFRTSSISQNGSDFFSKSPKPYSG